MSTWKPKPPKWEWRKHLTAKERKIIERADRAREKWIELNRQRAGIQNRAIQRAKYRAKMDDAHCRRVFAENLQFGLLP